MLTTPGGNGNYIDLGDTTARNFGASGDDFTVEFWFKEDDPDAELLGLLNVNFSVYLSSGVLTCRISDGGSNVLLLNSSSALNDNKWHHVAVAFKNVSGTNDSIIMYVDLAEDDAALTTFHPNLNSGHWFLGVAIGANYASASFDELRFWDDFRTADEILTYTNDTLNLSEDSISGLVGYFRFGSGSSTGNTIDLSSTGVNYTEVGSGFTYTRTTAPCPYFTVKSGSLFADSTWADGQGAPDFPNDYLRIWVRNEPLPLTGGNPDFRVGGFLVQYDTVGVPSTQTATTLRRAPSYFYGPIVADLVVKGPNYFVAQNLTVTRSIKSEEHPGNCPHCGSAEMNIRASGRLNFNGTSINYTNGTIDIYGVLDIKSAGHSLNLSNTDITIHNGGLWLSEAAGTNTWNLSGGSVTIEYGGAVTNTNPLGSPVIGAPTVTVKHKFGANDGWRHFCSPNVVGDLTDFTDDITMNFAAGSAGNVYYWDASEDAASGNAVGWVQQTSSTGNPSTTPFAIYTSAGNFPLISEIEYTGIFSSGSTSTTVYNYYDPQAALNPQNKGWNMLVNPYPGGIDISRFVGDYDGDGTITGSVGAEFPLSYKGIHVWDALNGQYVATLPSGLSNYADHDSSILNTSATHPNYIRPFTAFWVKMDGTDPASTSIVLQNPHRYVFRMVNGINEFHQSYPTNLRLRLLDADSSVANTLIAFNADATDQWDVGREAYYLASSNPNMPGLWTESSSGTQSIMSLDMPFGNTKAIPVVTKAGVAGIHYLDFNPNEYHPSWQVWVVDSTAQVNYDLRNGPYAFSINQAGGERKLWILSTASFVDVKEFDSPGLNVLNFSDRWEVHGEEFIGGEFQLIDMSGRVVSSAKAYADETIIEKPGRAGVYIIRYSGNNKLMNAKVIR